MHTWYVECRCLKRTRILLRWGRGVVYLTHLRPQSQCGDKSTWNYNEIFILDSSSKRVKSLSPFWWLVFFHHFFFNYYRLPPVTPLAADFVGRTVKLYSGGEHRGTRRVLPGLRRGKSPRDRSCTKNASPSIEQASQLHCCGMLQYMGVRARK